MSTLLLMVGTPTDYNKLFAEEIRCGLLKPWSPGLGYRLVRCPESRCGILMWIGPRQRAVLKSQPNGFRLCCINCAAAAAVHSNGPAGTPIYHLGGR